jgi:hypothetical protein
MAAAAVPVAQPKPNPLVATAPPPAQVAAVASAPPPAAATADSGTDSLSSFLAKARLEKYTQKMIDLGAGEASDLSGLSEEDMDGIGTRVSFSLVFILLMHASSNACLS